MHPKSLVAVLLLLGGSLTAGYFAYQLTQNERSINTKKINQQALNDIKLHGPDNAVHQLSKWNGVAQIVNYWATWCGPCREEIPVLVAAQKQYSEQNLVVLGLSMDYPEDTKLVTEFIDQYHINYPVLMAADVGNQLAEFYGADNFVLPISIFITAQGEVKHVHTGLLTQSQLDNMITDIL